MSIRVMVTRRERLAKKLFALAPKAEQEVAKAALKSATEIVETAQRFVPVRTGRLRESGRARLLAEKGRVVAIAGFTAPHSHLVEFGTRPHGGHPGTSPQPFLFPSYRLNLKRIKGRFSRTINKTIKDIARR